MSPLNRPQLRMLLDNKLLDMQSAFKQQPDLVLKALVEDFPPVPAIEDTLTQIQLTHCFQLSLQAGQQTTPYRLHTIVSELTAATDNKQVINLLQRLPKIYLQPLVGLINRIKPHPDFVYMVDTLERKKPARLSKRRHIPEPHSRRRPRNPSGLGNPKPAAKDAESAIHGSPLDSKTERGVSNIKGRKVSVNGPHPRSMAREVSGQSVTESYSPSLPCTDSTPAFNHRKVKDHLSLENDFTRRRGFPKDDTNRRNLLAGSEFISVQGKSKSREC
ncbi:hypothetical protein CNMCM8980_000788 [Aspergillus fumigatiaffinis]|nr:hypothetical protein CNMCM5878_000830 [Aspergillus fumigatiaffinis]KAF4250420.1 hypothetical protein CNMCM8980_000788 [Aspergillus fumigatiaffinis]